MERIPLSLAVRSISWKAILLSILCGLIWQNSSAQPGPGVSDPNQKYKFRGVVVNAITGDPIQYCFVQLTNATPQRAVFTDAGGQFEFANLPAGKVMLLARKPGFHAQGRHRAGLPYAVELTAETEPFEIRLLPEAVIAVHVTNDRGEAVEGAALRVTHSTVSNGHQIWEAVQGRNTDDAGNSRIADLLPGKYYVAVQAQRPVPLGSPDSREGYPGIVYYGGSTDRSTASPVEVKAGQHLHLEFPLKLVPTFNVAGQVAGFPSDGNIAISISDRLGDELGTPRRFDSATGSFTFQRVPAGSYVLKAMCWQLQGGTLIAEAPVNVTRDVAGIRLSAQPQISIPVTLHSEGAVMEPPRELKSRRWVDSQPALPNVQLVAASPGASFALASDGNTFLFKDVKPGIYSLVTEPGSNYVRSATSGSIDLLRQDLVVTAGATVAPIELTLASDFASLTVKGLPGNSDSYTGILMVCETAPRHPLLIYSPGQEITHNHLPPGAYKVFAFDWVDSIAYNDPEVLAQYASKAAEVMLLPNGHATITLNVIPVEEQ